MSALREHIELLGSVLCSAIAVPYLALWHTPNLLAIFVKILPCVFLFLHLGKKHLKDKGRGSEASSLETLLRLLGLGSGAPQKEQRAAKKEAGSRGSRGRQRQELKRRQLREGVAFGLVWSLFGDVFLIWINEDVPFMLGMLAFGVAQMCYVWGLGFWTVNKRRGGALYTLLLGVTFFVLRGAPLAFMATVPLYSAALITTLWRAWDRHEDDDGRSQLQKSCSVIGAMTFVISDTCIAFSKFVVDVDATAASAVIHATYFSAQTLLALGAA